MWSDYSRQLSWCWVSKEKWNEDEDGDGVVKGGRRRKELFCCPDADRQLHYFCHREF